MMEILTRSGAEFEDFPVVFPSIGNFGRGYDAARHARPSVGEFCAGKQLAGATPPAAGRPGSAQR
jgi:hypothetical protein